MAKKKENNHFISEFQLKHFGCPPPPKKPGKYYVWVYDKNEPANCKNTRWVGSSSHFYGKNDDQLEDMFQISEGKNGQMFVNVITKSALAQNFQSQMGDLFWILAFRTRAMRERLRSGFSSAIDLMAEKATTDEANLYFKRGIERKLDEKINEMLSGLNIFERLQVKSSLEFRRKMAEAREVIEAASANGILTEFMQSNMKHTAEMFRDSGAVEHGHNEGLKEFLLSGGMCPDSIRPKKWHVILNAAADFVLGDTGVFSYTEKGLICPLIGISSDWHEVYLPINPSTVVVGVRHDDAPRLGVEAIKNGSISTAYEQFYANVYSSVFEEKAKTDINTNNSFFDGNSLEKIVSGVWS